MINTTGLTHPALDKITRITPIICYLRNRPEVGWRASDIFNSGAVPSVAQLRRALAQQIGRCDAA